MAALPTAPQVNGALIGFGPCPWKPLGGGCGVFSTLTPSCTREGETPPQPHQAPGFAESPGQGVAAVGSSSFWGMGRKPAFPWGEKGHGEITPAAGGVEPETGLDPLLLPQTPPASPLRGTPSTLLGTGALCVPGFVPTTALGTPIQAHQSRQSFSAFLCSLPIARAIV